MTSEMLIREAQECVSSFQFSKALQLLSQVTVDDTEALVVLKLRVLLLLGEVTKANSFYQGVPNKSLRVHQEVVIGLLSNLQFYEASLLAIHLIKKNIDNGMIINELFNFLLSFNKYSDVLKLLTKKDVRLDYLRPELLLRLAVRLQMMNRLEDSESVLCLYLKYRKDRVPLALPWLLCAFGERKQANSILENKLRESEKIVETFQEHYYYLKTEHKTLFNDLLQRLDLQAVTDKSGENDMELIFTRQKLPPPLWSDLVNRIFWRFAWIYEGKNFSIEDWFCEKARLAALSARHLDLITRDPSGLAFLRQYAGEIKQSVINKLESINESYVLVTSHSIYPGALALLMNYLPNLFFVRNAAVPFSNTAITSRSINIGPPHLFKHNLAELAKMDKHIRQGGQIVLFMDHHSTSVSEESFKLNGFDVTYNNMATPYIWAQKLRSFWIDADFKGASFEYELSEMPLCSAYNKEEDWRQAFFSQYHELMSRRFFGEKGICNPNRSILEDLIPQQFATDFEKISNVIKDY